ncbi:transposase [Leptospira noguchii str. 2007001578]|uniref:Transposase n=2 Tax=Leptospira noguchii TaxID=28182 RepID=A0ABN0J4G6_9LEPT|nr:transposase [Leptospira noguchii str. 2007001578]
MVKRNNYSQEYKNKVAAEICGGTSAAVISKREHVSVQTLNNWKAKYLSGEDVDRLSQSAVTDMRKKLSELSVLYAVAMLEIQILKKRKNPKNTQEKREFIRSNLSTDFGIEKSCASMMMPVSTYYYQKKPDKNEDWLVDQMSKVIEDFQAVVIGPST